MKKTFYSLLSLFVLFGLLSLKLKQIQALTSFSKTVYVEIDRQKDSTLFVPYSKAWLESWNFDNPDLRCIASPAMNAENYLVAFNGRSDNLYTLLHPKIINGALTLYSPYDPKSFQVHDDGELRYPIKGTEPNDNFLNSQELRDQMCHYLGLFGPQSTRPLANQYGEDSTVIWADGTVSYVYPPRNYEWYRDSEIIKYKVRLKILVKKNGDEKKRIIESIAPMVFEIREGQITGERELFWLDYNEIKPHLKEGYFFNERGKPITYLKYFEEIVIEGGK